MKKTILMIVGFLLMQVQAQHLGIKLEESKVFKMNTLRVQNDYILPDGEGGFITISTKRSGFLANPLVFESYATHYNNKLEKLRTKTFKLNKGSIKGAIKGAFVKDGHLYLLNLESNFRKRYYAFKIFDANIKTAEIKEKEIFHIKGVYSKNDVNLFVNPGSLFDEKMKYYSDVNYYNPKIIIKFSENNRFFAIIHRDFDEKQSKYFVDVFDSNFNKVFSHFIMHPVQTKMYYLNDVSVSDQNGDVYIAAKLYNSDPMFKRRFINKDNLDKFIIYKVSELGYKKYDFKPKKVIADVKFVPGNDLSLIGFYRNKYIEVNDTDGIMMLHLNPKNMELKAINYQNFKSKLVKVVYKTKRKRSKNHKMIIRKVFKASNGDLIINSEDYYVPLMDKKEKREGTIVEIVGDMFSIKINQSGQILWSKKIYKSQVVKPRLALHSFFPAMVDGTNYMLFTDSRTQAPKKGEAFYLKGKELQNLNGISIQPSGGLQQGIIKENKHTKYRFMPIEGTMISPNEAIIPAKDHQFIKFFKLTFS